ncbi:MAG: FG-GAP-like repeat-containing protein [Vicinamibacterales bacterium]
MTTIRGTGRPHRLARSGRLSRALIVSSVIAAGAGWIAERGHAQAVPNLPFQVSAAIQANCLDGGLARVGLDQRSGAVHFVGSNLGRTLPQPSGLAPSAAPEEAARHYLSVCGSLFGANDPSASFEVRKQRDAGSGRTLVRFQQVERGIPVIAGELLVNLNARRDVVSVSGEVAPRFDGSITPAIAREDAADTARELVAKQYQLPSDTVTVTATSLEIFAPGLIGLDEGPQRLVWRMEVRARSADDIRELVLIDAQQGSVALHFNQVETIRDRQTYTANNGSALPGTVVCLEADDLCGAGDAHAQGAHRHARDTYDFYLANHGRDAIDGAGGALVSTVHFRPAGAPSAAWANAGWDGTQMLYGDAYGFAMADDVVAHELTHGVTQYESGLFYFYQSGAINESFSDVWGEFVDQSNGAGTDTASVKWLMGEDVDGLGAIRSMSNPPAYGHPDKMTSSSYSGTADDNGGVHRNSGISNKAAFLMTDGGSFNGQTITGLGLAKVARIYYEVNANLLTSGADYSDLYNALYQGCLNLVGSAGITLADCAEVRKATVAVEMNLQPLTGTNIEAPTCPVGQSPRNIFFDDLEHGAGNFTFGAIVGSSRWQLDAPGDPYAHSGRHELYANDTPAAASDTTASMTNSYTLPANAYLRFDHSFFFEQEFSSWDGGVVEYSADGGASWVDAGALFDAVGYNGALNVSTNPLTGRAAFVRSSHGYVASRATLASLAGQSVRFRWRMGLDNSVDAGGWWLDDIRIYTCGAPAPTDVNGDGWADLLWRNTSTGDNRVWYLNGSTVATQGSLPPFADPAWQLIATADFNADGHPDAIWRNTTTGANVVWYLNGTTISSQASLPTVADLTWHLVASADVNRDGSPDLIWRNQVNGATLVWYLNGVTLVGQASMPTVADLSWTIAAIADMNGDAAPDLLWHNVVNGATVVWNMNGVSMVSQGSLPTVPDLAWTLAAALDVNADGKAELFWRHRGTGATVMWSLSGLLVTNQLSLQSEPETAWHIVGPTAAQTPSDVNGDQHPDLVWHNTSTGANAVWLLDGTTLVSQASLPGVPDLAWQRVATADLNGDGHPDLIWRNSATGAVLVWLLSGTTVLDQVGLPTVSDLAWQLVTAADVNEDAKPDLIWRNTATGANVVWYLNGTTLVTQGSLPSVGDPAWRIAAAADVNGDGHADLFWRNATTGANVVWYLSGPSASILSQAALGQVADLTWQIAAAADVNGDGHPDVMWRNATTGENVVWFLNGTSFLSQANLPTVPDAAWVLRP